MTHPEHIDPDLARRKCNPDELEIIHARNQLLTWTQIGQMTGRSRGTVRRIWGQANRKVNGGYVPPASSQADEERAIRATDPDVMATWRGIPIVGKPKVRGFRRPNKDGR